MQKWKISVSGGLVSWPKINKSGFYMTTGDSQLSGWTKKQLQSSSQTQTCTPKRSWSLSGGLLLVWSTTAFWIPAKPLHRRSMLGKSMRCTNRNSWSQYWSTERAQFFSTTTPWPHVTQATLQKLNELGYKALPHPPHSPDRSPTDYHFFKHLNNFLQGKHFHNRRRQKMLSGSSSNPKAWVFMLQE